MDNPNIKLNLGQELKFYSPEEQGWGVSINSDVLESLEQAIKKAAEDALEHYNEILADNLRELLTSEEDTGVSLLDASFLRLQLGDGGYENSLHINLAPAVKDTIHDMQNYVEEKEELVQMRVIVEFWEGAAKEMRDALIELENKFAEEE